jgi:pimeloyl-ACP methyl ester carboxylesterase
MGMKRIAPVAAVSLLLLLVSVAQGQDSVAFRDKKVDVGGYRLQFHIATGKPPTIVFEAGGGDNSSVWSNTAREVGRRTGARMITYDRAGLGQSDADPRPYSITREVEALERGLKQLQIDGDVILVAHSYGGFLAALFAARNPSVVKGVVLIDPNLASFFTDSVVDRLMGGRAAQREQLRKEDPKTFATMEKVLNGFPETVRTMRGVNWPAGLRITDIVAEKPPMPPPDDARWIAAHKLFDKGGGDRRGVFATGSGHYVMRDRPDLVVGEIVAMVQAVQ